MLISFAFIIAFIFCLATAIASTMVGHQLITTYKTRFSRNYFYYLVTFYAFSFYGIWSQIIMRSVMEGFEQQAILVSRVINFLPVLGIPFLFISWIMLLKMSFALAGKTEKKVLTIVHSFFFLLFIFTLWALFFYQKIDNTIFGINMTQLQVALLASMEAIYMIIFGAIVLGGARHFDHVKKAIVYRFLIILSAGFIIRLISLPLFFYNEWLLAGLLVLYFMSNAIPLLYLRINADKVFEPIGADNPSEKKLDSLYSKFRITRREREIIEQICLGKTNQQIADSLFISLQTVKDHNHRIYSKIGINSRLKLVQLINT